MIPVAGWVKLTEPSGREAALYEIRDTEGGVLPDMDVQFRSSTEEIPADFPQVNPMYRLLPLHASPPWPSPDPNSVMETGTPMEGIEERATAMEAAGEEKGKGGVLLPPKEQVNADCDPEGGGGRVSLRISGGTIAFLRETRIKTFCG